MQTSKGIVAFYHWKYDIGGSSRVTEDTCKLLEELGYETIFFTPTVEKEKTNGMILPKNLHVLPQVDLGLEGRNLEEVIRVVRERNIKLLIFVNKEFEALSKVKEAVDCKVGQWFHTTPGWEFIVTHRELKLKSTAPRSIRDIYLGLYYRFYFKPFRQFRFKREIFNENYLKQILAFDYFFVLCPQYKYELISNLGISPKVSNKIIPLINTIDVLRDTSFKKKNEVVFVGRLDPQEKDVSTLVNIWGDVEPKLPDWEFNIYGHGSEKSRIEQIIDRRGLKRITLCGHISDPSPVYDEAEIVCLSSPFEGVPMVFLEAQNRGCIPVAFDVSAGVRMIMGSVKQRIGNISICEAGVLVKPYARKAYAEALYLLLGGGGGLALREELRQGCLKKRLDYAPDVNVDTWRKILQEVYQE